MMALRRAGRALMFAVAVALCLTASVTRTAAQLHYGFYAHSCPQAESLVKEAFNEALKSDDGIGADLVRMHFHDCFVRGCDGSILIDGTNTEKTADINKFLEDEAYDVVDNAKEKIETVCKGVVSCADILAFVARDAVAHYGGYNYDVPAGRRDGRVSLASEATANLPTSNLKLPQLTANFARKGLTQEEMITLSGAHTIGVAHCEAFGERLYPTVDPTLDPSYAAQLKGDCPTANTDNQVPMDPPSPLVFDNSYYQGILKHRGLFTSDQTLESSPSGASQVQLFAANSDIFKKKFAAAMVRMGNIGVLTGSSGAHTIGVAHCEAFGERLYPTMDPTLDPSYAAQLKGDCPTANTDNQVPMDPPSPLVFDNSYYQGILKHRGLFTSDQTLESSPSGAAQVQLFAANSDIFKKKFAAAMVRMGNIGVLTGSSGEIRRKCSAVN